MEILSQVCITCGVKRHINKFPTRIVYSTKREPTLRRLGTCRLCENKRRNTRRKNHPTKADYYKEQVKKRSRKSYLRNSIKKKYGITTEDYLQMLDSQDRKCAICSKTVIENNRYLSVDHCHTTGKVRGLLCSNCNLGLGYFQDNIDFLLNAVEYLKKDV